MSESWDALSTMAPALLFLCAAVPLAALLDELGFFGAVAAAIERRFDQLPVVALWCLAAATTAVLNLDTTIVLLTPLYVRLARASGADPLGVALVPLLLASFASCVLPVSNLTTLLVVERLDVRPAAVLVHLAPVSLVACTVGWWSYRRRHPEALPGTSHAPIDRRAVRIGSFVVAGLLVGFVVGPTLGIEPWFVTLVADVALVLIPRRVPWRAGPLRTARGNAALAVVVTAVVPADLLEGWLQRSSPLALAATFGAGATTANVVNNLPATFIGLDSTAAMGPGLWAWLAGVNIGAALLPIGALANLLWWRILRDEGVAIDLPIYVRAVVPVALPAVVAAAATVALLGFVW